MHYGIASKERLLVISWVCLCLVGRWPRFASLCLVVGAGRAARLVLVVNGLVGISVSSYPWKTEVDVVFATPLTVHLVDKEAGNRFEQQAQDGHAPTKAKQAAPKAGFSVRIEQPKMNNVSQDSHCQPNQEH